MKRYSLWQMTKDGALAFWFFLVLGLWMTYQLIFKGGIPIEDESEVNKT